MNDLTKHIQEQNFQKIKLLSGRSIGIRGWLMKEEKEFLFAVETKQKDKELVINECLKLAKKCVDNQELFDTLSRNDLLFILAQLRKLSKGSEVDMSFFCASPKCPDWMEFTEKEQKETGRRGRGRIPHEDIIDIEKDAEIQYADFSKPIELKLNTKIFKFFLKEIPFNKQFDLEKEFLNDKENIRLNEFNWNFVMNMIDKVQIGEEVHSESTDEQKLELLELISPKEFKKMNDKIIEMSSRFLINKTVKCPKCEYETEIIYDELFSLMIF